MLEGFIGRYKLYHGHARNVVRLLPMKTSITAAKPPQRASNGPGGYSIRSNNRHCPSNKKKRTIVLLNNMLSQTEQRVLWALILLFPAEDN